MTALKRNEMLSTMLDLTLVGIVAMIAGVGMYFGLIGMTLMVSALMMTTVVQAAFVVIPMFVLLVCVLVWMHML